MVVLDTVDTNDTGDASVSSGSEVADTRMRAKGVVDPVESTEVDERTMYSFSESSDSEDEALEGNPNLSMLGEDAEDRDPPVGRRSRSLNERPDTAMTMETEYTEYTTGTNASESVYTNTLALESMSVKTEDVGSYIAEDEDEDGEKEKEPSNNVVEEHVNEPKQKAVGASKRRSARSPKKRAPRTPRRRIRRKVSEQELSFSEPSSYDTSSSEEESEHTERGRIAFRNEDETSIRSDLSSISGSDTDSDDDLSDGSGSKQTRDSSKSNEKESTKTDEKDTEKASEEPPADVKKDAVLPQKEDKSTDDNNTEAVEKTTPAEKKDEEVVTKTAKEPVEKAKVAFKEPEKKTNSTQSRMRSPGVQTRSTKKKDKAKPKQKTKEKSKEKTKGKSGMKFFGGRKSKKASTSKSVDKRASEEKVQVFSTGRKQVSTPPVQDSEKPAEKASILKSGLKDPEKAGKDKKVSFNAEIIETKPGTATGVKQARKVQKKVKTKKKGQQDMTMSTGLSKRADDAPKPKKEKGQSQVPVFLKSKDGRKMKETKTRSRKAKNTGLGYTVQSMTLKKNAKKSHAPGAKVMRVCKLTKYGYVVAEFPSDDPKNTPLHVACLTHYPGQFILEHLMTEKHHISTQNSDGELPLHYAMKDKKGVEDEVMDALLSAYPDAARHQDIDENLPIHTACMAGTPSMYAIKCLISSCPKSLLVQNDLRVPLDDDDQDGSDDEYETGCFGFGINDLMELFGQDKKKKKNYETAWSPLHLAALHGAPPAVIELMLETNYECMSLETNQGRTAIECAKWIVVNALLRNVSITAYRNTFAAIEIMQSYDKEVYKKEVLTIKAGMARAALESVDSIGTWWFAAAEMIDKGLDEHEQKEEEEIDPHAYLLDDDDDDDSDLEYERGLTPLHRAVISRKGPDEIKRIISESQESLYIRNTEEKTPIECAKVEIIEALIENRTIASMKNTILALEIMEQYNEQTEHDDHGLPVLSRSEMSKMKSKEKDPWKVIDKISFMKSFATNSSLERLLLGDPIKTDNDLAIQPANYLPPGNLKHVNLRINLPVGYRRLRWALLHYKSKLLTEAVYSSRLKYTQVFVDKWNAHYKHIGLPISNVQPRSATGKRDTKRKDIFQEYLGAEKRVEYKVPKSSFYDEHTTYENIEIVDYNDYCFAIKSVQRTPDIPEGKLFETHTQIVVVDKGIHNCRMICSSEVVFLGQNKLKDEWRVKNVSRYLTTDFFVALADAICDNAGHSSG